MRNAASFIAAQSEFAEGGILADILQFSRQALKSWKNRRQLKDLTDFDEHMLADIGLTRHDLREALELPFSSDLGRELHVRAARNNRRGWNA
jgi:uncharacterized protein YjiS (DUF1127 family)